MWPIWDLAQKGQCHSLEVIFRQLLRSWPQHFPKNADQPSIWAPVIGYNEEAMGLAHQACHLETVQNTWQKKKDKCDSAGAGLSSEGQGAQDLG